MQKEAIFCYLQTFERILHEIDKNETSAQHYQIYICAKVNKQKHKS